RVQASREPARLASAGSRAWPRLGQLLTRLRALCPRRAPRFVAGGTSVRLALQLDVDHPHLPAALPLPPVPHGPASGPQVAAGRLVLRRRAGAAHGECPGAGDDELVAPVRGGALIRLV